MTSQLRNDDSGATIVEFALLLMPMCLLLIGGFDLGYQSYIRTVMQGALNDAARRAAVESPQFSTSGNDLEEKIETYIAKAVDSVAVDPVITVTQQSYFEFSQVGKPETLMTDVNDNGEFDAEDGDCWEDANGNGEYDMDAGASGKGNANDVVFYTADITVPRLFPIDAFLPVSGDIVMTLETAIRNQPYDNQPVPAVVCAEAE